MTEIKFKTNINCSGCLSKVSPVLNAENAINEWTVDLKHEDRILTIKTDVPESLDVPKIVGKAGFQASIKKFS
jgi:copper chaperone